MINGMVLPGEFQGRPLRVGDEFMMISKKNKWKRYRIVYVEKRFRFLLERVDSDGNLTGLHTAIDKDMLTFLEKWKWAETQFINIK